MTIDRDRRMTPEQIRRGTRRLAWGSPVIFLIMFLVARRLGLENGAAFLLSLCTIVAPWFLVLPIIIWGARATEGLGIIAAILRIFEN